MKNKKSKIFFSVLVIVLLIFNVSFNVIANAATSDLLISQGTGQYAITVTKTSTVDDIIKVLGEPKLTTPSAFGGEAYSFYTDDNYSNYLYIETTAEGKIISYGSFEPNYKTATYSYGDDYPYSVFKSLMGCIISGGGYVAGGVYYNRSAWEDGIGYSGDIIEAYEERYLSDPITYLKGLAQHGVLMFNAYRKQISYLGEEGYEDTTPLRFNEDLFYINEQFKEYGTTLREYMIDTERSSKYMEGLGVSSNVEITRTYYVLNPALFAQKANIRFAELQEHPNALFDYDINSKVLSVLCFSENTFEDINEVPYTDEEQEKLEAGREEYQKAVQKLNLEDVYVSDPVTDTASGLVAGEIRNSAKVGILEYVNAIRVAAGVPKLQTRLENYNVAQHKATLLSYRYWELGEDITHSPEQPAGVSDEFYKIAMGNGFGYGENVGTLGSSANGKAMMQSINILLDDSAEIPQLFSHRQKILSNEYQYFGYGISPAIFVNEFSGTNTNYTNFLEAWPSNGVTFMETLVSPSFQWTAQFIDKYTVLDTTTATVECLNTGETWEFKEQENTSDRWFACHTNSVSSLNNKVVIYDSDIVPQAGYVYKITLHGLEEKATSREVDFSYRAVFEYADINNYPDSIGSLSLEVPEDLEQNGNSYTATVRKEIKLNAIIDNKEALEKKMTWTSSNPDLIEVTQNGTLTIKKESDTPVTIRVVNDKTGLSDEIQIKTIKLNLLKGDMDKNGRITPYDALLINVIYEQRRTPTAEELEIGDIDGNGRLTPYDALLINIAYENRTSLEDLQ